MANAIDKYPEHVAFKAVSRPRETGSFAIRHRNAVADNISAPIIALDNNPMRAFEAGLLHMLCGLTEYAGAHVRQYGSPIAEDGVLGVAWRESLAGLRQLLNGELGRLDGGTLDRAILELYKAAGFEGDEP
jgi:hypothetical protein